MIKKWLISFGRKELHRYRQQKTEEKAGFKAITPMQAYALEDKLTIEDKRHYCERKAYAQLKYFPNLDDPRSYNEKLIWLALYYKNPVIAKCTDKFEFKEHLCERIGRKYCIPTIGVYDHVRDIDFAALPDRFVIKSTAGWGSKQVEIVKDKDSASIDKIKSRAAEWLYPWNTYYYNNLCTTDDKISPRIIIEPDLSEEGEIKDYKVFCFNGKPTYLLVVSGRGGENYKKSFYDLNDFSLLPIRRNNVQSGEKISRSEEIDEMIEISKRLSADVPLVRIDFYITGKKVLVGEMTFYPGMFLKFNPREWDYQWGNLIDIGAVLNDK